MISGCLHYQPMVKIVRARGAKQKRENNIRIVWISSRHTKPLFFFGMKELRIDKAAAVNEWISGTLRNNVDILLHEVLHRDSL